jgi:hypothetical protein
MTEQTDKRLSPIQSGSEYTVDRLQSPFGHASLLCTATKQRNWTRVGTGHISTPDKNGGITTFLKQNIDRDGQSHPEHWLYEQTGAEIAHQLLQHTVRVPRLRYKNESLLLNVYEHVDLITIDELLRSDPATFDKCFDGVIHKMLEVLEILKQPPAAINQEIIPAKSRSFGGPGTAINFKGFEIRNAGLARTGAGSIMADKLVMFDFVRPYLAPIEEAAAKLFVSIGLLNWGIPVGRFVRGPDTALLARALKPLEPFLDRQAVLAEINLQSGFRTRKFLGSGNLERYLKRLGVSMLGKRYLYKLKNWCERHIY